MRNAKAWSGIAALTLLAGATEASAQSDHELAYNGEIGRIINENCVVCHQEGGIGPMAFENYDQVRPWAPLISYRVANREMPPYAMTSTSAFRICSATGALSSQRSMRSSLG